MPSVPPAIVVAKPFLYFALLYAGARFVDVRAPSKKSRVRRFAVAAVARLALGYLSLAIASLVRFDGFALFVFLAIGGYVAWHLVAMLVFRSAPLRRVAAFSILAEAVSLGTDVALALAIAADLSKVPLC